MQKRKLTKRQEQAIKTRNKIYNISVELMGEKGFNNITIEEISKKAGVSVGAFYHYYKSKDDILFEIYKKADEYFENEVAHQLRNGSLNSIEQIIAFFGFYAKYNNQRGVENVSLLYNTKNKLFIEKKRYMLTLLKKIISEGQEKKEILTDMTAESINEYFLILSRGVVYDWCLHSGDYDLEEVMVNTMERTVAIFKVQS